MATCAGSEFSMAVNDALSCLHKSDYVLKPEQMKAIKHIYGGKDVFVWLPTGYGKSTTYQALPFVFDWKLGKTKAPTLEKSVVLVVSPLISLMVDQTRKPRDRHTPIHSL